MRTLPTLLLVGALEACGAPGSDAVFTSRSNRGFGEPDSAAGAPARPVPRMTLTRYSGYYYRLGEVSQFRPCGTEALLDIFGTAEGRQLLQERFRFNAVWQGRKMFGIFQGAIVTDTPRAAGAKADTVAPVPRMRFFITGVDSLRTWQASDCGGMRIP